MIGFGSFHKGILVECGIYGLGLTDIVVSGAARRGRILRGGRASSAYFPNTSCSWGLVRAWKLSLIAHIPFPGNFPRGSILAPAHRHMTEFAEYKSNDSLHPGDRGTRRTVLSDARRGKSPCKGCATPSFCGTRVTLGSMVVVAVTRIWCDFVHGRTTRIFELRTRTRAPSVPVDGLV